MTLDIVNNERLMDFPGPARLNSRMARPRKQDAERDEWDVECGERLRRFRERALRFSNQGLFAKRLGVLSQSLSDYEVGKTPIPPRVIRTIERDFGATGVFQYVYSGSRIGLMGAHDERLDDPRFDKS